MKILGIVKVNNVHRNISFFVNNSVYTLLAKNYSSTELVAFFTGLSGLSLVENKLFATQIVNFRFYNRNDRDYVLSLSGFTNYITDSNRDINVSIKGMAQYEINVNFNTIVEYKVFDADDKLVASDFILASPFANEFIKNVENGSYLKFYSIYIKDEELTVCNNIIIS